MKDLLGLEISGADAAGFEHYSTALAGLQRFVGDPVGQADAALAANPDFVMAHVIKGYLYGLSTEAKAMPILHQCVEAAERLPATGRESGHVVALRHLLEGRWHEAGKLLAAVAGDHPTDVLALQAGHQIDYFTGNTTMLRERIARALPAWESGMPGYHAVLGMHAFGLEENGAYADAEATGRRAIELEPRDGWAQHAVAHVMEMQCRQRDGIAWMRANPNNWTKESFFQGHNWWHLALFHYELGETDEVLALHDGPIYGGRSGQALNMVDASAILWRLHLGGVDVGGRWQALADDWAPLAGSANYAFNDAHAMMAFVGAGRQNAARTLLEAQEEAMRGPGDNAAFTRDVGHPVTKAIHAFGMGDYALAARLIAPVRAIANRFGGSHAQRDFIELTLIEAALRAGDRELAQRVTAGRFEARPDSPFSTLLKRRADTMAVPGPAS